MTQSSWPSSSSGIALERGERLFPAVEHLGADLVAAARLRGRSRRRTCGRAAGTPTAPRSRCSGRVDATSTVARHVGSCETVRIAGTGPVSERSLSMKPSSIIASTIAVVPTFRNVATSQRFASPTITCRRRYFCGSACGSSRVLTIGRLSVVSSPTSSSKKSAR